MRRDRTNDRTLWFYLYTIPNWRIVNSMQVHKRKNRPKAVLRSNTRMPNCEILSRHTFPVCQDHPINCPLFAYTAPHGIVVITP